MQTNYPDFLFISAKRHKKLVARINYYLKFSYNVVHNTCYNSVYVLKNNALARDCTFSELGAYLEQTKIDRIKYDWHSFDCKDFALLLHNEAEIAGIRAGFVVIEYMGGVMHACNCFNTTDRGLIFIDVCGTSREINQDERFVKISRVKKRKRQNFVDMFGKKQYAITPKVKRFSIVW